MENTKLLIQNEENNNILLENDLKLIDDLEYNEIDNDIYELNPYLKDSEKYFMYEITRYKLLSPEEEKNLLVNCKNGDEQARQNLINSNLRLVASIAIKCKKNQNLENLDLLDLMQEGTFGLMDAIDTYDFSKGVKLSTYSTWHIKKYIFNAIKNTGRVIRVSTKEQEKFNKLMLFKEIYQKKYGVEPSIEELSTTLGYDYNRIIEIINNNQKVISYDIPLPEYESMTLKEIISSEENIEEDIVNGLYYRELWKKIKDILTEREYIIMLMRCGKKIGDKGCIKPKTLSEIANLFGISAERVRVIESDAIQKINRKIKRYR